MQAFQTWAEVETVADELDRQGRAIVLIAASTGLRPEEWIALERGDVDTARGTLTVRRVYTDGQVKLYGKQTGSLRTVPLPHRAVEALRELPARLATPAGCSPTRQAAI